MSSGTNSENDASSIPTRSTESHKTKPHSSKDDDEFDYRKLGQDLLKKIEHDELYWKQNQAKVRAVSNAVNYEDFRQIVLAAHLTPLKAKEKDKLLHQSNLSDRVVWNVPSTSAKVNKANGSEDEEDSSLDKNTE